MLDQNHTTIEQLANRCDKVRWQGRDSFTACCVLHDDRNPSMSVTERDGRILAVCHAGCDQSALFEALVGKGGRPIPNTAPRPKPRPKPTANYARDIWKASKPDSVSGHPYAIRKRIEYAFGARRGTANGKLIGKQADCIVVPNRDWEGNLVGVECVNADGVKQTFGSKGLLVLGYPEDSELIHVCEGWATAWALSKLFPERFGCVVAFGKTRLEQYAHEAQERFSQEVAIHYDTEDNMDVWDVWDAGKGDEYITAVLRTDNVR
jgi:hypothetical protein